MKERKRSKPWLRFHPQPCWINPDARHSVDEVSALRVVLPYPDLSSPCCCRAKRCWLRTQVTHLAAIVPLYKIPTSSAMFLPSQQKLGVYAVDSAKERLRCTFLIQPPPFRTTPDPLPPPPHTHPSINPLHAHKEHQHVLEVLLSRAETDVRLRRDA